ncbi:MAG: hypothetical protein KatS3mg051_1920 [Anaerolineae bacterium]|nr:MAG: hypothetical protein KatS3mg051_1920 [Anaerolineae bacterium]
MAEPTPWQLAADELLAAIMTEAQAWQTLRFELGLMSAHFPPGLHRQAFLAIDRLRLAEEPTTLTAIVDAANGQVPLTWLSERALLAEVALAEGALRKNAEIARLRAQAYAQMQAMEWAIAELRKADSEQTRRQVIARVVTMLGDELATDVTDATALAAGERFAQLMESAPQRGLPTGVQWMDEATGGLLPGEIWWIAGAYKMRKSSLMRNLVLGAARAGGSVTLITLESPQNVVVAQFVTMLAAEFLLQHGLYGQRGAHGLPLQNITAKQLLTLRGSYRTVLDRRQVEAVQYGIAEYKRLARNLRVYDATPQNGNVRSLADVQTLLLRDKTMYGAQVIAIDYLQRLGGSGETIFERVSHQALQLQSLALRHSVTIMVLAQQNEETVRGKGDEHSPGIKGGGDPAATADYLFITRYPVRENGKANRERMQIELRLSRHGQAGVVRDMAIHPASGLLLPETVPATKPVDLGL